MHRPVVVLPQPLSPTSPRVSPRRTIKSIPSTAFTSPTLRLMTIPSVTGKCICNPLTSRSGLASIAATLITSFVEPDRAEILVEVMARADPPPLDVGSVRNDPVPPQQEHGVRLVVEHVFLKLAHQRALFGCVGLAQHLLIEIYRGLILEVSVILGKHRARQIPLNVEWRVWHIVAIANEGDLEITLAHGVEPRSGRNHALRD